MLKRRHRGGGYIRPGATMMLVGAGRLQAVAESIRKGFQPLAQAHFPRDGYEEGRLPFPT